MCMAYCMQSRFISSSLLLEEGGGGQGDMTVLCQIYNRRGQICARITRIIDGYAVLIIYANLITCESASPHTCTPYLTDKGSSGRFSNPWRSR